MRLIFLCILLSHYTGSLSINERNDRWFSEDKTEHVFLSAFILGASYYVIHYELGSSRNQAAKASFVLSLSTGVFKELYDLKTKGNISLKDLIADLIGIGIGTMVFVR